MARRTTLLAAILAGLGLWSMGCEKQEDPLKSSMSGEPMKNQSAEGGGAPDAAFLSMAAQANLAEVAMGRLAVEKTENAEIKKFGQHMIDDHTAANAELMDLAQKKEITVPGKPDAADEKTLTRLAGMSGADFDRTYVTLMVQDHVKAVALFETYSKEANDPEIRTFAQKTLPVLREHLKMARDLAVKVAAPTSP